MKKKAASVYNVSMKSEGFHHHLLWYVMITVLVFCYTYQFSLRIIGFPDQFHSIRFAAFSFYVIYCVKAIKNSHFGISQKNNVALKFYRSIFILHIFLFIYMLLLYFSIGINEGEHMVVILMNFFIIRLIPIYLCYRLFDTIEELMHVILWATLLQTIFIWISLLNPSIATAYDLIFHNDALEFIETHRSGYAGGIGCITAPGYIRYSLGQIACFYLFAKKDRKMLYTFLFLSLFLTGALIARTGLFIGGCVFAFMLYHLFSIKKTTSLTSVGLVMLLVAILTGCLLSNKEISNFFYERFYRMNDLVESSRNEGFFNNSFFEDYMHNPDNILPPLSIETMIGLGVPSGVAGNGIRVNIDGGYLRIYATYGLILALFFYFFVFGNMLKIVKSEKLKVNRQTLLLIVTMLMVSEYKEWTFYGTPFIWLFTLSAMLAPSDNECTVEKYRNKIGQEADAIET